MAIKRKFRDLEEGEVLAYLVSQGVQFTTSIQNVIIVGASIIEQTGGQDLVTPNATITQDFVNAGMNVDVYFYGWSGFDLEDLSPKVDEVLAAFPNNDSVVIFHGGGNDVTITRPYVTATTAEINKFNTDLDVIINKFIAVNTELVVVPLTFRAYADPTVDAFIYNNQDEGSLPYNTNIYLPRIPSSQINTDGNSVIDVYNRFRNDQGTFLQTDGIHPLQAGKDDLVQAIIDGVNYLYFNAPIPAPIIPEAANPNVGATGKVVVSLGSSTALAGFNTIIAPTGLSTTPVVLQNISGSDTDIFLQITSSTADNASADRGNNTTGRNFGSTTFDDSLENNPVYNNSIYMKASDTFTYTLSGFAPNQVIDFLVCGSRVATDSRVTLITSNDAKTASFDTSIDPPVAPQSLLVVAADASGVITLTQSTQTGTYSYLGGIEFTL